MLMQAQNSRGTRVVVVLSTMTTRMHGKLGIQPYKQEVKMDTNVQSQVTNNHPKPRALKAYHLLQ